jgi:hypothetical protein
LGTTTELRANDHLDLAVEFLVAELPFGKLKMVVVSHQLKSKKIA